MNKKVGTKAYVCAFCIAAASNFGFSVIYAYTSYYVAFQTATGFTNTQLGLLLTVLGIAWSRRLQVDICNDGCCSYRRCSCLHVHC